MFITAKKRDKTLTYILELGFIEELKIWESEENLFVVMIDDYAVTRPLTVERATKVVKLICALGSDSPTDTPTTTIIDLLRTSDALLDENCVKQLGGKSEIVAFSERWFS